jgi:hypothetical protein
MSVPHIPDSIIVLEDMMGCVPKLKYADHDVTEVETFPELAQEFYMENTGLTSKGILIMEPKQWITRLYNSDIMNLLEIPHYGRGKDVNACIQTLLAHIHGGFLWMDLPVLIDVNLIAKLTRLPTDGVQPM